VSTIYETKFENEIEEINKELLLVCQDCNTNLSEEEIEINKKLILKA
jgi:predicted metal-binding protein